MYCKLSSGLKILKFSKFSSYFFVYSVANADEFTVIYPLSSPAQSCTLRDTMCFRGFYQRLMCELGLEGSEEELLLAGGLDGRNEFGGVTVDETVGCCHVKDKFAANELGGGVVGVGAE